MLKLYVLVKDAYSYFPSAVKMLFLLKTDKFTRNVLTLDRVQLIFDDLIKINVSVNVL